MRRAAIRFIDRGSPPLPETPKPPVLPHEALEKLREGFTASASRKTLTPEENEAVAALCKAARESSWTPEQLIIAVKDTCYTSPEIAHLTPTSERDAFLARIVTACIKEFFRKDEPSPQ